MSDTDTDIDKNNNTGMIPAFQNSNQQRMNVLRIAFNFIYNLIQLPQERFVQIQPIINRSSVLIRAVISKFKNEIAYAKENYFRKADAALNKIKQQYGEGREGFLNFLNSKNNVENFSKKKPPQN